MHFSITIFERKLHVDGHWHLPDSFNPDLRDATFLPQAIDGVVDGLCRITPIFFIPVELYPANVFGQFYKVSSIRMFKTPLLIILQHKSIANFCADDVSKLL